MSVYGLITHKRQRADWCLLGVLQADRAFLIIIQVN